MFYQCSLKRNTKLIYKGIKMYNSILYRTKNTQKMKNLYVLLFYLSKTHPRKKNTIKKKLKKIYF